MRPKKRQPPSIEIFGRLEPQQIPETGATDACANGGSFVGAAFELGLFAYGNTDDWRQFTLIRQDVILKIADIVEVSGTRLAGPTRLNCQSSDAGIYAIKGNATVRPFVAPNSESTRRAHPTMGE